MMYGLTDTDLAQMRQVFMTEQHLEKAILYGSRAKGNYKPYSDIDITFVGAQLTEEDVSRIAVRLDDLLLPYNMDISRFASLGNKQLKDHISRRGVVLFESV